MKNVAGYIERKTMLYKTGVEYGDYTMNHVLGCAHGCMYPCYAYLMKKRFGQVKTYEQWCEPMLVSNTLELLDKEIPRLKDKIKSVHLCFSTDPFMYDYPEIARMSLAAIEKLNARGIKCTVLTKGVYPNLIGETSGENEYGITLVTLNEEFRKKYEPCAAPIKKRLDSLRVLHWAGYKTWVSMEPYPTPNLLAQNLKEILKEIWFVDKIVFGRINYNTLAPRNDSNNKFFNDCAKMVLQFGEWSGIDVYIKEGTLTT